MKIIKQWTEGKLTFKAFSKEDEYPDLSYLGEYDNKPATVSIDRQERGDMRRNEYRYFNLGCGDAEYIEDDYKRYEAYNAGDWYMMMIGVEISVKTKTNWAESPVVGRAYLHGVESDSGQDYIDSVVADLVEEAKADYEALKEAVCNG